MPWPIASLLLAQQTWDTRPQGRQGNALAQAWCHQLSQEPECFLLFDQVLTVLSKIITKGLA
jgi:hypothetical protein